MFSILNIFNYFQHVEVFVIDGNHSVDGILLFSLHDCGRFICRLQLLNPLWLGLGIGLLILICKIVNLFKIAVTVTEISINCNSN